MHPVVPTVDRAVADGIRVVLARPDPEDDARAFTGSDDHVLRAGRAVEEVPLSQRPLLAFDDGDGLAGENEEVLLVGLPVVHSNRLARLEQGEPHPELGEVGSSASQSRPLAAPFGLPPRGLARIQDEPASFGREQPVLRLLGDGFGDH